MSATAGTGALRARLLDLLAPAVTQAGCDLEDVTVSAAGRRRVVRVVVDRDGGMSLDAVAEVSTAVSALLDSAGASTLGDLPYVLEVTSPGVDRPLTQPRHWRRAQGRLVRIALQDGRAVTGRLVETRGTDEDGNGLEAVLDDGGQRHAYAIGDVARAQVQVEFAREEA